MLEKWQDALEHWDTWVNSIKEARAAIVSEHGNLSVLMSQAKLKVGEESEGLSNKVLTFSMNDDMRTMWDIDDQLVKTADDFVTREVGLRADSLLHSMFSNYWVKEVFPEFRQEMELFEPETDSGSPYRNITLESKRVKSGQGYKVRSSISWFHGHVDIQELSKFLQKVKWPFEESKVNRQGKGGRPRISRETTLYPEAIVCYLLNKKQRLRYKEIADIFGWKTHEDSNGNLTSNTVRNRVNRGRDILKSQRQ